jgi:hypothetical protein
LYIFYPLFSSFSPFKSISAFGNDGIKLGAASDACHAAGAVTFYRFSNLSPLKRIETFLRGSEKSTGTPLQYQPSGSSNSAR